MSDIGADVGANPVALELAGTARRRLTDTSGTGSRVPVLSRTPREILGARLRADATARIHYPATRALRAAESGHRCAPLAAGWCAVRITSATGLK